MDGTEIENRKNRDEKVKKCLPKEKADSWDMREKMKCL